MGRNQWRDEQEWPLARTQYTPYYFRSEKSANSLKGDGRLSTDKPGASAEKPADQFVYDPNDPVPTLGGCNLFGCPAGPHDQTKAEERAGRSRFHRRHAHQPAGGNRAGQGGPLCGQQCHGHRLDGQARRRPSGRAIFNLCDGILRTATGNHLPPMPAGAPTLIEPGKVYRYQIDLWVTSNVFLPGHKIRVEISSSNFPRFDRNPNTGHAFRRRRRAEKGEPNRVSRRPISFAPASAGDSDGVRA